MTLNINAPPTTAPAKATSAYRHRRLVGAVRDELLSWNPREFISAFRRWHHGAISLIHLNVLTILDTDGPSSMSHLAEALDVSVASMTGIVDRMERRGLVERRHDGKDRRVVHVHPTDAGRDVFREIDERRRVGLGKLLERLDADELDGLLKGHRALRQARAEAAAARGADPTTPPELHRASTIHDDDPPVKPTRKPRP